MASFFKRHFVAFDRWRRNQEPSGEVTSRANTSNYFRGRLIKIGRLSAQSQLRRYNSTSSVVVAIIIFSCGGQAELYVNGDQPHLFALDKQVVHVSVAAAPLLADLHEMVDREFLEKYRSNAFESFKSGSVSLKTRRSFLLIGTLLILYPKLHRD